MPVLGHHLFYACMPPAPQRSAIAAHRARFAAGASSIVCDARLHMTLGITPLFERYPEDLAERMQAWADSVALDPVRLALDRLTAWSDPMRGDRGAICLRPARCSPMLAELSRQLCAPLSRHRRLREGWGFNPHVTLLYRHGLGFEDAIETIGWEAAEFVLIHSIVGAHRHRELGRWRLASRQGAFDFG